MTISQNSKKKFPFKYITIVHIYEAYRDMDTKSYKQIEVAVTLIF